MIFTLVRAIRRYEVYYFDPPELRRRLKPCLAPTAKEVRRYHRPLRIFFNGSSLMCCSVRGEHVLTRPGEVFRRNGFYEPRTEAPAPRVNGGLNSTVTPVESTFGRDTRDSLYGFTGSVPFLSEGPRRVTVPRSPLENGGIHARRTLSLSYLHSNFSSNRVGTDIFKIPTLASLVP